MKALLGCTVVSVVGDGHGSIEPLLGDLDMELWKGTQSFIMAQLSHVWGLGQWNFGRVDLKFHYGV